MSTSPPRVGVIGAGIAGLTAARQLEAAGVAVTVLEREGRPGGCIRTTDFAGRRVDVGAESLHAAAPGPLELTESVGLGDEVVPARAGRTWLVTERGLRMLPDGVGPYGPTRLGPLVTSRLLSPRGMARAALEPMLPRRLAAEDVSVATAVAARFGDEVVTNVVGPLLGGLHAGDVHDLSLQAAAPQLADTLARQRSVVLATLRRRGTGAGFLTVRGGLQRVVEAAAADLSTELRTGTVVTGVEDTGSRQGRYRVQTDSGDELALDGVVVAVPPLAAGGLLAGLDRRVQESLRTRRAASVAVVLLSYPAGTRPVIEDATGLLLPPSTGRLLRAATFLTAKWPHLDSDGRLLVRASAGRIGEDRLRSLDDRELVDRLTGDLAEVTGLGGAPAESSVTRWPDAMPQLEVGHRRWLSATRALLDEIHPGLALAGGGYDGVGVAAAMRSGASAASHVLAALHLPTPGETTAGGTL